MTTLVGTPIYMGRRQAWKGQVVAAMIRPDDLIDDRPSDGVFRVHRDVFRERAIFAREMKGFFESNWVHVTHRSGPTSTTTSPRASADSRWS